MYLKFMHLNKSIGILLKENLSNIEHAQNENFLFLREKKNIVSSFCVLSGCLESDLKQIPGQITSTSCEIKQFIELFHTYQVLIGCSFAMPHAGDKARA